MEVSNVMMCVGKKLLQIHRNLWNSHCHRRHEKFEDCCKLPRCGQDSFGEIYNN